MRELRSVGRAGRGAVLVAGALLICGAAPVEAARGKARATKAAPAKAPAAKAEPAASPEAPPPDGAKADGAKADGAKPEGAKPEGAKADGAKADGAKADGAKAAAPPGEPGKSEAPAPEAPAAEPAPGPFRQAAPGAPQPSEQVREARRHFDAAVSAFQLGRLGTARIEFTEAYRLSQEPDLLINLAVVCAELDKQEEAILYYERYLAARPKAPERAEIERVIRDLDARAAADRRARADRELARRPPPPPAPPAPPRRLPAGALGLLGAGGGALLSGVALLGATAGIAQRVNSGERFDAALLEQGRALQQAGIALSVIGGVGAVIGGAWLIHDRRRGREGARLTLGPLGAGAALGGSF